MATVIPVVGEAREVSPKKGRVFKLAELRAVVGGDIQAVPAPDGRTLYLNEHGKYQQLPRNTAATTLMRAWLLSDDYIAGDVILCSRKEAP
jgi:hypothetical protein